jgi:hypothetical protein
MVRSILVRLARVLPATLGALLAPAIAIACPFCYAASSPRTLHAFYVSTAALTVMPLMLIGGFAVWISRAYKKAGDHNGEAADTRPALEP